MVVGLTFVPIAPTFFSFTDNPKELPSVREPMTSPNPTISLWNRLRVLPWTTQTWTCRMPTKLQGKPWAESWSDGTEGVTKEEDDDMAIVNKDTFLIFFFFLKIV
jgi:hypothetical protein